jgi:hypothetical protein
MKFHAKETNRKVAEYDQVLDCTHSVSKEDVFYVLYNYGEPIMWVCKNCVILDK